MRIERFSKNKSRQAETGVHGDGQFFKAHHSRRAKRKVQFSPRVKASASLPSRTVGMKRILMISFKSLFFAGLTPAAKLSDAMASGRVSRSLRAGSTRLTLTPEVRETDWARTTNHFEEPGVIRAMKDRVAPSTALWERLAKASAMMGVQAPVKFHLC